MNQRITLIRGIRYLIAAFCLLIFLLAWPMKLIQLSHTSKSDEAVLRESDPISVEHNGTQMFLAEGIWLKEVELYVANDMGGETITFRLYDSGYSQLWETFYQVDEEAGFPGFIRIPIGLEMVEGWQYYYTVEGLTADLTLYYEDTFASTSYANGTFLYGGAELPEVNLIIRYRYTQPLTLPMLLALGLGLGAAAFGLWKLLDAPAVGKRLADKEIPVQRLFQWFLNPLVALLTVIGLLAVFPGRKFGVGIVNYGFYYLGILITAGIFLFGINYPRQGKGPLITAERIRQSWPEWGMCLSLASALWYCAEYMNGLYDIFHAYSTCKILVCLSMALIFTFKKQDVIRLYNLFYVIAAPIAGYYYARPYRGVEEQGELYRLQAWTLVVGGFFLLQFAASFARMLMKKEFPRARLCLPYAGCLLLLMSLLVIFNNTRTWVLLLAAVFALFYLRMWMWEKRDRLLPVFGNALILSFLGMVVYCLLHRPYQRFRWNRYGMYFHTVTMTGYYLALVLCAILVRLIVQYRKKGRWQEVWKELSILGMGNVYLFLTLSRTGYLAAAVMELFAVVFAACMEKKRRGRRLLTGFGFLFGSFLLLFPAVFTLQRILPAVYNDPIYSEVEEWEYTVIKDTPADSELYLDFPAFVRIMGSKLFGLDMGNISLSLNRLKPVYIRDEATLLADNGGMEEAGDISNGRLEIFREYIGEWNLTGHEKMGIVDENGEGAGGHAHNAFLQVIHDHGLITGLAFVGFGLYLFVLGCLRAFRWNKEQPWLLLVPVLVLAFGAAGMVEWIFHFANPFGFSVMVIAASPLFCGVRKP